MSESRNRRRDEGRQSAAMSRRQIERLKRSEEVAVPEFEELAYADEDGAEHARYVLARNAKERLDKYLQNRLKHVSRSQVQRLIDLGGVSVNGRGGEHVKASLKLKAGDVVDVVLPPRPCHEIVPEPIPLDILFEDEDMIVLNKQADLMVHPARSILTGTLLNALAHHFITQHNIKTTARHNRTPTQATDRVIPPPSIPTPIPPPPTVPQAAPERSEDGGQPSEPPANQAPAPDSAPDSDPDSDEAPDPAPAPESPPDPDDHWLDHLSSVGMEGNISRGEGPRPGIVHRLDKHTTGVMVVAKRDETHWMLAAQFEHKTNLKCYLAVVHGVPAPTAGVIHAPLGKHHTIKEAQAVRHDPAGRESTTIYRTREQYDGYALVELELKTGRTHQIRVHLAYLGYPIVGDILYGGLPVGPEEIASPPTYPEVPNQPHVVYARDKETGQKMEAQAQRRKAASDDSGANPQTEHTWGEGVFRSVSENAHPEGVHTGGDDFGEDGSGEDGSGGRGWLMDKPALHAALLRIRHPTRDEDMTFTAPLHEPMRSLVLALRRRKAQADGHDDQTVPTLASVPSVADVARGGTHVDLQRALPTQVAPPPGPPTHVGG